MRHDTPVLAAMLAVLKAGRTVVALNATDPPARLAQVLDDAGAGLVLTDAAHRACAEEAAGPGRAVLCADDPAASRGGAPAPAVAVGPDDMAFLIYTSGSTGRPKGVVQTHRNILHNVHRFSQSLGLGAADRVVHLASLSGGHGVTSAWCALLSGAALCPFPIMEKGVTGLAHWMREQRITFFSSSASVFRQFMKTLGPAERFPDVRLLRLGSEAATSEDFAAFRRHFPGGCTLIHTLASSETGIIAQVRLGQGDAVADGTLPAGRPVEGVEVRLLDEHDREVPPGETGEIAVRSRYLSPGYWRNEALTAERFSGAANGESRSFRTGDLGRRTPDGSLVVVGRKDARVKVRGHRIEPSEVEGALLRLPGVEGAVVGARPGPGGDDQLVAYLTCRPGHAPSAESLRRALRETLPGHMVPSGFEFLDRFPLTPHGKIDREKLRQLGPAPSAAPAEGPATPTEADLAGIWGKAFGGEAAGRQDNFFDRGGDSLLAAVVAAHVHARWGVELELRAYVDHPTLAGLAELIDRLRGEGGAERLPPLAPVPRDGPLPLSFAQERVWKYSQTPDGSAGYTMARSHVLRGPLDVEALRGCLNHMARRHEILRTTFAEVGGRPVQTVHPPAPVEVPLLDVTGAADPEEAARQVFQSESRRPFILGKLPLLRFTLLRVGPDEHRLLRVNHHIISDGWSWQVYFRELALLYEARVRGEPPPLPESEPLQYADYAAWQRLALRSDGANFRQVVAWWKDVLSGSLAPLELPCKRPAPLPEADPADGIFWWGLDPSITKRLEAVAREAGATYFMVRLAAFVALLARETGRPDVVLGTYVTNRTRLEVQNLFGYFSNLVTLRFRVDLGSSFRRWLAAVRDLVGDTQKRSEIPYEQLCEELRKEGVEPPEIRAIVSVRDQEVAVRSGEVEFLPYEGRRATMPWGFTLGLGQHDEARRCAAHFDARLHDPEGVRGLIARYVRLLDAASRAPDRPLADLLAADKELPHTADTGRPGTTGKPIDWTHWHKQYDAVPSLQARLRVVREQIAAALDEAPPGPIAVVSVCAGDGRDVIEVLRGHPRRGDVVTSLLDIDAESRARGRAAAEDAGLGRHVRFLDADATRARSYVGLVPADLVLLSGMLIYLSDADVLRLLGSLPMLCKRGGGVILNRHRVMRDGATQVAAIRACLRRTGFEETDYRVTAPDGFACLRARFAGEAVPLDPERVLFEFVGLGTSRDE
jgi:amino acid adenylation domain-containing protein